jgi:hypothetical protein
MDFLGRTWKSVRRIQWSPPLHSTLEITAPIQLQPIDAISQHPTREMTPSSTNSSSLTSNSSLPTHIQKASLPISLDIPTKSTSLLQRLRTQGLLNVITSSSGPSSASSLARHKYGKSSCRTQAPSSVISPTRFSCASSRTPARSSFKLLER